VPKIIVGIGEADASGDAIALATRLAKAAGSAAELVLVAAYPYDPSPTRALNAEYESYLREAAESVLAARRAEIGEGTPVTTHAIAEITAAKGIQLIAEQEEAALIVLGSSHRGTVGRVLAGSTAERLLHGAPCPVAVAPKGFHTGGERSIATIGVGYDGGAEAAAALDAALAMASALGASVRIIEIVDVRWTGMAAMTTGPGFTVPPDDQAERTREQLAGLVASLPAGVAAEAVVVAGEAEHELAEQSDGVELMVVGSRGYGPHRAVLLGSVSGRLVRDAACPVIVVPRGVGSPLTQLFPRGGAGIAAGAQPE
jgi:nucleotide-binding universal stress UspA family protein